MPLLCVYADFVGLAGGAMDGAYARLIPFVDGTDEWVNCP